MAGIFSQGGSAGHRYAGWLSEVEAKNFQFGGKVFNGSPSAIYVGSNLVWLLSWLNRAAQQAILGAFGQTDGTAVIKATNAYLTQLAASGQAGNDKATALAGFINEDPMMVCSLGLQVEGVTMPIRKIVGNGSGYFTAGNIFELTDAIECVYKRTAEGSGYRGVCGFRENSVGFGFMHTGNLEWSISGSSGRQNNDWDDMNKRYKVTLMNGKLVAKNMATSSETTITGYGTLSSLTLTKGFGIFCFMQEGNPANYNAVIGEVEHLHIIKSDSTYRHRLVPYRKPSGDSYTCELLDLETGTLATRVGSFTIPDISYTPSTP